MSICISFVFLSLYSLVFLFLSTVPIFYPFVLFCFRAVFMSVFLHVCLSVFQSVFQSVFLFLSSFYMYWSFLKFVFISFRLSYSCWLCYPVFLNFFSFAPLFLGYKTIWRHALLHCTSKYITTSDIGVTPRAFSGHPRVPRHKPVWEPLCSQFR